MSNFAFIPHVQIRTGAALLYDLQVERNLYKRHDLRKEKGKQYKGGITEHAIRRLKKSMDIMMQIHPGRYVFNPVLKRRQWLTVSFTTLTISAKDLIQYQDANEALQIWLQHFKRPWRNGQLSERMESYVWRAELQERGQIHYHIACPHFLHLAEVRTVWNRLQDRRGWLEDFKKEKGHADPNSTDIHAARNYNSVAYYVAKYMCKNGPPIGGKIWDCSAHLKGDRFADELSTETENRIEEAIARKEGKIKRLPFCTMIYHPKPQNLLDTKTVLSYYNHIQNIKK